MVTNYVQNSSLYGVGESVVGQVRKANEDNCGYASTENGELFVVCDGMGGHVGGATASKIGVESIINYISTHKHADKRVILRDALVFANMQILGTASADAMLKGMGTTACIVLIDGDNTWLAHVGDSRIYLYSQKDKFLYRVSKDHSFVQGLVDSGQLDDRDAENHPQKNIILRALGIKEDMKPEVDAEPMHCAKGDIIMICSDGLSGMIDDVYMEKKIRDNKADLADLCQQLIDDANTPDKGKDNITCQLIRFEKAAAGAPKHPDFTPKWRRPGSAVAGAATAPVAGPTPAAKPKKMLWIGLAVLVILLAGGIVGGMMYLRNNKMHFFTASHTKTIRLTDNDSLNLGDKKLGLVKEIAVIRKWYSDSITVQGVHLSEEGVLTLDSSYNALGVEVKAKGEYKGKVFDDAIWISLEYVKSEKPVVQEPDLQNPEVKSPVVEEPKPIVEEPKKDPKKDVKKDEPKKDVKKETPKKEEPKKEDIKKEEPPKAEPANKSNIEVRVYAAGRMYNDDPLGDLIHGYKKDGGLSVQQNERYVFCIYANGSNLPAKAENYTLIGQTTGIKKHDVDKGWFRFTTDETYTGNAKLRVTYDGTTIVINLPLKK